MSALRGSPAPSAGARAWGVVALLSAAMAFSLVDRFALSLLFEPIKQDLSLSDTQLGLLHGVAFGLFYAALGIPIARLVDTGSRKWVIFWGVAVWSAATAACGLARSYGQLLGARIGVAAGEAALAPGGYSLIADVIPHARLATAIGVFQMGSLVGAGLAFLLGGWLYAWLGTWAPPAWLSAVAPHAWQLTFIALALPGLPLLALLARLREPARRDSPRSGPEAVRVWRHLKQRARLYGALFGGSACLVATSYAVVSWGPSVLVREFGWTIREVGAGIGAIMLTTAPAGVLAGGLLADRWSRGAGVDAYARVLRLSAWLSLPIALACAFARSGPELFAGIAALQFATGIAIGVGPAAVQPVTPGALRGRVSAVYVFVVNLAGLGVGPIVIGALSDYAPAGNGALLRSLATFCALACALGVVVLRGLRLEPAPARDEPPTPRSGS